MQMSEEAGVPEVLDGRVARGARTRLAVVDALMALHAEGDLTPTAAQVAQRAKVALRSVYVHFDDVEALYATASERQFQQMLRRVTSISPDLPLEQRLTDFAASRAAVLEWLLPAMRAAALRVHASPVLQESRCRFVAAADGEVRTIFGLELASSPDPERLVLLVHLVAGGTAWDGLRIERGLSTDEASDVLRAGLAAVFSCSYDSSGFSCH